MESLAEPDKPVDGHVDGKQQETAAIADAGEELSCQLGHVLSSHVYGRESQEVFLTLLQQLGAGLAQVRVERTLLSALALPATLTISRQMVRTRPQNSPTSTAPGRLAGTDSFLAIVRPMMAQR